MNRDKKESKYFKKRIARYQAQIETMRTGFYMNHDSDVANLMALVGLNAYHKKQLPKFIQREMNKLRSHYHELLNKIDRFLLKLYQHDSINIFTVDQCSLANICHYPVDRIVEEMIFIRHLTWQSEDNKVRIGHITHTPFYLPDGGKMIHLIKQLMDFIRAINISMGKSYAALFQCHRYNRQGVFSKLCSIFNLDYDGLDLDFDFRHYIDSNIDTLNQLNDRLMILDGMIKIIKSDSKLKRRELP